MEEIKKDDQEQQRNVLQLTINDKVYEWTQEYITGSEIRRLGNIPGEDEIFLAIKKPWEDEPISDDKSVNLARPEIEHFYSKMKDYKVVIVVNGRQKNWSEKIISFEQVVVLGFNVYDPSPDKVYTVIYDNGPTENNSGSMVRGSKVLIKDKMIFNVTATDKS